MLYIDYSHLNPLTTDNNDRMGPEVCHLEPPAAGNTFT
jgi:hypothetical protein